MSKYIIDIPKTVGVLEAVGSVRYTYFDGIQVQTIVLKGDEIEELNSDYINEHFSDLQDTAYQKGFEDGKAVNDKGCEGCKYSGTPQGDSPCFNCSNYYKNNWTAKDDKIEVGDEVEWTGDKYIVTYINYDIDTSEITDYDLLGDDGSVADHVKKCSFTKTGRHFDIASILEAMKHD